jgi:hypothetical protein
VSSNNGSTANPLYSDNDSDPSQQISGETAVEHDNQANRVETSGTLEENDATAAQDLAGRYYILVTLHATKPLLQMTAGGGSILAISSSLQNRMLTADESQLLEVVPTNRHQAKNALHLQDSRVQKFLL